MNYEFDEKTIKINDDAKIIILNYDADKKLSKFIDNYIVSICEGASDSDIDCVKSDISDYLSTKKQFQRIGAVSEFFAHLYFINKGFKQECLFFNLEENSPKKGFDGVYSILGEFWIMESKSRKFAKNVSHNSNMRIAYNDLNDKFMGKKKKKLKNNPWKNAYNHASHKDVWANISLQQTFKQLSNDFRNKKFTDCSSYNIIPCSTIIDEEKMTNEKLEKLVKAITKLSENFKYKKIILIAISSRIYDFFIKYLEVKNGRE